MRYGLISLGALLVLSGCPGDDSSGDSGASDSGSTTATTSVDTSGGSTSTPSDDSGSGGGSGDSGSTGSPGTDSGSTGMGGTDTGDSGTTGAGACADPIVDLQSAVGIALADFPPPPDPGGGGGSTTVGTSASGGGDGGGPPGDTLRLRFGNYELTCQDPYGSYDCKAFDKWRLSIDLPIEMQVPGIYDLADLEIFFMEIGAGVPPDCGGAGGTTGAGDGGGGGGWPGQFVIESIGPQGIVGCIDGAMFGSFDPNGSFQAELCAPGK